MRIRTFFAALALGVTGLAGSASAFTPDRAAIFVEALRANDCAMTADEAPELLPPLGLNPAEVQQFVDILFSANLVDLSEDMAVLSLSEALCTADSATATTMIEAAYAVPDGLLDRWVPDFTPEQGAAMIAAVRDNGCTMTDTEAGGILPQVGIDPTMSRDVAAVMLESGLATVDEAAGAFHLSEALCAADPAGDAATIDAARAEFVATIAQEETPGETTPGAADEGQ